MSNALIPIVPSSIAGNGTQSVDANGKITFSGISILNINDVFSATYSNYVAVIDHDHPSAAASVRIRLRAAGVDNNSSEYSRQYIERTAGTSSGDLDTAQTECTIFATEANTNGTLLYFYRPAAAVDTAFRSVNMNGFTNARLFDFVGYHDNATAYDGWSIIGLSTGTLSGSMMIYGFAE